MHNKADGRGRNLTKLLKGGRETGKLLIVFFCCVVFSVLFLLLGSLLPQDAIDQNLTDSIWVFESESTYPFALFYEGSAKLDNVTDAIILQEASAMRSKDLKTIFTNPMYSVDNPVVSFRGYIERRETGEPNELYVRYWQGFRTPVRFLLSFFDYRQIRKLLTFSVLFLMSAAALMISAKLDRRAGILFILSMLCVKPTVIGASLQYSSVFILTFISMLFVPKAVETKNERALFLITGAMTMFFDFYTAPLAALGYPLIFAMLLHIRNGDRKTGWLTNTVTWLLSYGGMWIMKLLLTTVFTGVNAFADAFSSFAQRTGIVKTEALLPYYNIGNALNAIWETIFSDRVTIFLYITCAIVFILIFIWAWKKKKLQKQATTRHLILLFPFCLLILWYCISAQPTAIHAYFQFRNCSMAFWGLLMYFSLLVFPFFHGKKAKEVQGA